MSRLSKDEYLWSLAYAANKRSTCDRLRAGCTIARDGILLAIGYNGSCPGEPHCDEAGHDIQTIDGREHCVRTIHAEINAIINAAHNGVRISDADWYITGVPCHQCSMAIVRLKPRCLFICSDMGGNDDWSERVGWWKNRGHSCRYPDRLILATEKQLKEAGVIS